MLSVSTPRGQFNNLKLWICKNVTLLWCHIGFIVVILCFQKPHWVVRNLQQMETNICKSRFFFVESKCKQFRFTSCRLFTLLLHQTLNVIIILHQICTLHSFIACLKNFWAVAVEKSIRWEHFLFFRLLVWHDASFDLWKNGIKRVNLHAQMFILHNNHFPFK